MNLGDYQLGWFDALVLVLIVVGFYRGRKRGMSEEFPLLIQWSVILAGGALLHKPVGELISDLTGMGKLFWYVTIYVLWALSVKAVVTWIVRAKGDKVNLADNFGKAEYPLGICAGMIRFVMVIVFSMALLNARLYTNAELKEMAQFQQDNFGDISLPTISSVQTSVFKKSLVGKIMKDNAEVVLIKGTRPREVRAKNRPNKKKNAMDYWT